jgi:pilus assembly protein CpaB
MFSDAIATLELDPVQGETLINASKIGVLSLALRSITDFKGDTREASATQKRTRNQAIRIIRFGQERNIMAGSTPDDEPQVDPAAFAQPVTVTPAQPGGQFNEVAPPPDVPGNTY